MRYLALVALVAFLIVPFVVGCQEKPTTPAKDAPKVAPESPPAKITNVAKDKRAELPAKPADKRVWTPESGIQITAHNVGSGAFWRITNSQDSPLIIKSVVYNGEYPAVEGTVRGCIATCGSEEAFPFTLTIGDSMDFLQWYINESGSPRPGYRKAVMYVDIDTNRGLFRYTTKPHEQDSNAKPTLQHVDPPTTPSRGWGEPAQ